MYASTMASIQQSTFCLESLLHQIGCERAPSTLASAIAYPLELHWICSPPKQKNTARFPPPNVRSTKINLSLPTPSKQRHIDAELQRLMLDLLHMVFTSLSISRCGTRYDYEFNVVPPQERPASFSTLMRTALALVIDKRFVTQRTNTSKISENTASTYRNAKETAEIALHLGSGSSNLRLALATAIDTDASGRITTLPTQLTRRQAWMELQFHIPLQARCRQHRAGHPFQKTRPTTRPQYGLLFVTNSSGQRGLRSPL